MFVRDVPDVRLWPHQNRSDQTLPRRLDRAVDAARLEVTDHIVEVEDVGGV